MPPKAKPDTVDPLPTSKLTTPPIASFLESYLGNTIYVYRGAILDFLDFLAGKRQRGKKGASAEDMERYEVQAREYLSSKRDYSIDYLKYVKHLNESGVPPKTAHIRYFGAREFLAHYDIKIDEKRAKDAKRLKPKGGRRTNIEYADKKVLAEILHHCDARFRAFILVLLSSGMRIGEALDMKWSDISFPDRKKYPEKPTSIFIRNSKNGFSRTTYITREAEAALIEWRKVSGKYQKFATKRSENLKNPNVRKISREDTVFAFARTSVYERWEKVLKDAEHYNRDEGTKRVRLNIHRLRNFFSVQVASAAGQQVSDILMGHADPYGGAYSGRPEIEMEDAYLKAEPSLTIGTVSGITGKLSELERENAELKERLAKVEIQSGGMDLNAVMERLSYLENQMSTVRAYASKAEEEAYEKIAHENQAVSDSKTRYSMTKR
jgi:integrase